MSTNATWHDILKFEGVGGDEIVNDVRVSCPEFTGVDTFGTSFDISKGQTTISGDKFTGIRRIESDAIEIFKQANAGIAASKGTYEKTLYELSMAGAYFRVDQDLVKLDPERGANYMKAEGARILEDVIKKLGVQFFYGHGDDKSTAGASLDGFQGLEGLVDSSQVTSAGGTVSGTSTLASAYLVRFNPYNGVTWLFGNGGTFETTDIEPITEFQTTNDVTTAITWLTQAVKLYPGVAVNSKYSVARIANIQTSTSDTVGSVSTTAFTDEHILHALLNMKERPDAIFMPTKCGLLLGASRALTMTVRGSTLKGAPLTMPAESHGVPILYTDSLIVGEAAVA